MGREVQHLVQRDDPPTITAWQLASEPGCVYLALRGRIARADVAYVCDKVSAASGARAIEMVVCDVGAVSEPDLGTVDALARMQLTARRRGSQVRIEGASVALRDLLALVGLREVVRCEESDLEASGKAEGGEEAPGVEEESDPADPTA